MQSRSEGKKNMERKRRGKSFFEKEEKNKRSKRELRKGEEEGKKQSFLPHFALSLFLLNRDVVRGAGFPRADGGVDVGIGVAAAAGREGESRRAEKGEMPQRCRLLLSPLSRRPSRRAVQLVARGPQGRRVHFRFCGRGEAAGEAAAAAKAAAHPQQQRCRRPVVVDVAIARPLQNPHLQRVGPAPGAHSLRRRGRRVLLLAAR